MTDDPQDPEMQRRSRAPSVGPWVVIGLIVILGLVVYVFSAVSA